MPFTYTPLLARGRATQLTTAHTVGLRWGASLSADWAIILADASVTPPSPK